LAHKSTYQIDDFIFELTEIQSSDLLANISLDRKDVFQLELDFISKVDYQISIDAKLNQLLKKAQNLKRSSDTNPFCLAFHGINWTYKGKVVTSPLFLLSCDFKINRYQNTLSLIFNVEDLIINPFVKNQLLRSFDFDYEEPEMKNIEDWKNHFQHSLQLSNLDFELSDFIVLGNFHYHRFQIVKELEGLLQTETSNLVSEILGGERLDEIQAFKFTNQSITELDINQNESIERFQKENIVLQGPPGTGKSQVITNILSKFLYNSIHTINKPLNLVVSEKKAALEVLVKKLSYSQLDNFTFIFSSDVNSNDFIQKLKKTWQFLDQPIENLPKNLMLSEQLHDNLAMKLGKLSSKELIGGVSFNSFKKLAQNHDLEKIPFKSNLPSIKQWVEDKPKLIELSALLKPTEGLKKIKQSAFYRQDLGQKIDELISAFHVLSSSLNFKTIDEIKHRIKQSARCQLIENETYKNYSKIFSDAKLRQKVLKARVKFLKLKEEFSLVENEKLNWKIVPTVSQIESWNCRLKSSNSWWIRRKLRREIVNCLNDKSIDFTIAITNFSLYLERKEALSKSQNGLLELGIENPSSELESIYYLIKKIEDEDENEINTVMQLASDFRKELCNRSAELQKFKSDLFSTISLSENEHILDVLIECKNSISDFMIHRNLILDIDQAVFKLFQETLSIQLSEALILKSNQVNFEIVFPSVLSFDGNELTKHLEKIIDMEKNESELFSKQIIQDFRKKFSYYHKLLLTSSQRLTSYEKELKTKLKIGKSLLIKAFKKTKNQLTIRELFDSEAIIWIEILCPIILSNPIQVANHFKLKKGLFNAVIFDEASQILLSNALGSLHRADRVLIAGDEQQMSPSSYFSSSSSSPDLLHQASFHWAKIMLKHHYRSQQPELIEFSNRNFYENTLIVYPSPRKKNENPIESFFIESSVYSNRMNEKEAEILVTTLKSKLKSNKIIGVVSFSESQLNCIWNKLSGEDQLIVQNRVEDNTLFFRSLENVQGDECDELLISLAYAKDEAGQFNMRFGPLNQQFGSKRLNVLFSRAKEKIYFFHSVSSKDFKWTNNESINLLKQYIQTLELYKNQNNEIHFPFNLKPIVNKNTIKFISIQNEIQSSKEILTLYRVLKSRGWNIEFEV
jgi:superfamily I DNA and/or RNA helicase